MSDASRAARRPFLVIAGEDDASTGAAAVLLADEYDLIVRRSADVVGDGSLPPPDLLVVDERVGAESGLVFVEAVRERVGRYVPALLMTPTIEASRDALMAGFEGVVMKPLDPGALIRAVRYLAPKPR